MWKFFGIFFMAFGVLLCWSLCRASAMADKEWERIMRMKEAEDEDLE